MVRIRVTEIPGRGLQIEESLSLEALNNRMAEAPNNDIQFTQEPAFSVSIKPELAGAELKGSITTRYLQPCGVCLQEVERELSQSLELTLKAKTVRPGVDRATNGSEWEDGVGIIYFDGEHIDLEEILQETIILSISPFDTVHTDCPGLPQGAQDDMMEKKPTLGDLLKKALPQ